MLIILETGRRDLWYRGTEPAEPAYVTASRAAALNAETEILLAEIDRMLLHLPLTRRTGTPPWQT